MKCHPQASLALLFPDMVEEKFVQRTVLILTMPVIYEVYQISDNRVR